MEREILEKAADLLIRARNEQKHLRPRPGQAEYLDLIRAVAAIAQYDKISTSDLLEKVSGFVLKKNAGAPT